MSDNKLKQLQEVLGVTFSNTALLQEALTHSSYVNENSPATANERLEFVGDAVLGLILAEKLFLDYPDLAEGDLTRMRSQLVCRSSLATIARTIGLGDYLYLGQGEATSGGRGKPANLAGALEALFAAIYLDRDWQSTRECVMHIFKDDLARISRERHSDDYKSHLQEALQHLFKAAPSYHIIAESGPDHNRQFTAEVVLDDKVLACGVGRSKKLAEADAARTALEALRETAPSSTLPPLLS
ncbi:MAG: ribonuclease III [Dehalococcoidia bacterium]|nr:ribonuclease III [Dehalococcoidia bacterium]